MVRPATATVAVFVGILLVAAAVVAGVGLGTDGASAVRVGGQTTSRADVNAELRALWENEELRPRASRGAGSVASQVSAGYVTFVVREGVARELLARDGEQVTAADERDAAALGEADWGQFWATFPREFRVAYVERSAAYLALARVLGIDAESASQSEELSRTLQRAGRRLDVWVDPVYGVYRPVRVAVAPASAFLPPE